MAEPELTEEEIARRVAEELKRLKVSDVLLQTFYTVSSLGYRRLSEEDRDLEQARLAIDAMRALAPVLEGQVPVELTRDFGQVTANMQLAYAKAVSEAPAGEAETPAEGDADAER